MKLTKEISDAFEQGAYGGSRDDVDAGLQAVLDLLERDYSITGRLCAALMPGTFDVVCELDAGHDGPHTCPVTEQKTWGDNAHKAGYAVPLDNSSNVQYSTGYDSSGVRESLDQVGSETRTGIAGARSVEGVGPAGDAQRSAGASDDHDLRGRNQGHAASGGGSAGAGIRAAGPAAPEPVGAGDDCFGTVTTHYVTLRPKCSTCGVTGGMPHDCETAGRIS